MPSILIGCCYGCHGVIKTWLFMYSKPNGHFMGCGIGFFNSPFSMVVLIQTVETVQVLLWLDCGM